MQIVPFKAEHLFALRLQPAQAAYLSEFTPTYAHALEQVGGSFTALVDGQPIACAGLVEQWRGRALAWALLSQVGPHRFVRITRAVRRALELSSYTRIEAQVDAGFAEAITWAELLGFRAESVMAKFTPEGRDAFMYVRIR